MCLDLFIHPAIWIHIVDEYQSIGLNIGRPFLISAKAPS
jgi:hypothetical protein